MTVPCPGSRDLGGTGWIVREALGDTWQWYVDASLDRPQSGWWPASVPGSVLTDLARVGEVPDPYRGRNTRACEWTGARSWVYRRTVDLPELAADEWATVEFDGVDPSGSVFWDGRLLGRIEGLYRRARFAVPADDANAGTHRLAVVIDPVPASQPQVGRTDLVRTHRPRLNEGWDFCPRFPHQGIWRDCRLVLGPVQLAGFTARTELDAAGTGRILLAAELEVADDRPVPVAAELVDAAGRVAAQCRTVVNGGRERALRMDFTVTDPRLWWPHGFGDPTTYTVALRLMNAAEPVAQRIVGFRRATLVPNAGAPEGALPYSAVINDTAVPLLGWNWAPVDAQYGAVPAHRVEHLVTLAKESGARILRVWGGGLIETEEFYAACDRAGLLVWQEFSLSSSGMFSAPATDPEFVALMADEAAAVVPTKAHHPSLLLWGGGNELDDGAPLDERRSPVLAALRDVVARLDPGRAWVPSSPSGPTASNRLDLIEIAPQDQHDVHGPWEHQGLRAQHTLYNAGTSLAHTEFGAEGMTNRRALDRLVPAADRWPADRTNPVYQHLGDWWNNALLVRRCFGNRLSDLPSLLRASQLLQATGLAYAVEANRRRFPRCSTVLPWQLAESYPNAWCTSSIDHSGEPKPAYHAVARAFEPERLTVRVPTSVWAGESELTAQGWLWSESIVDDGSSVLARLRGSNGEILAEAWWHVDGAVDRPRPVGELTVATAGLPADAMVAWDLTWLSPAAGVIDREVVLASTGADFAPLLDLAPATIAVAARPAGDGSFFVEVTHEDGPLVPGLRLLDDRPPQAAGWLVTSGDPRPLLPGETRAFTVRPVHCDVPARVLVDAWNTSPLPVDLDRQCAGKQES